MANEQLSLFSTENQGLSLKEVALQLSVSQATVRNWIHSGFLSATNGVVFQSDIDSFVAGQLQGKLKSRANKIRKDSSFLDPCCGSGNFIVEALRRGFSIDYQRPFKGLLTKAKAFVMAKEEPMGSDRVVCVVFNQKKHTRSQNGFLALPKHILNFELSEEENDVIRHVYATLSSNTTRPFFMNFQPLKPQCCGVFVWLAVA